MKLIEETLKKYGDNLNIVFVFPSRIAAMLWFQKSLNLTGLKTVPAENYISWDVFKEKCLISSEENLLPVSNIIRNIFAEYICRKNAEAAVTGEPLFTSIIPSVYAKESTIFSKWIAGILPQLDHFEKRSKLKSEADCETKDFLQLKKMYSDFLQKKFFFEPSWSSSQFVSYEKKYIIIYPELIEDFSEHAELLKTCNELTYIHCSEVKNREIVLDIYDNARSEVRGVALQIEKLLSENVPADEIAVSVPDIENYTAYIKREFSLRGIPAEFRSGFKLGNEQSGKLFSLIFDCVQHNFSFEFIKPVILNNHIPWKDKTAVNHLIEYGIKNNCAVSWKENTEAAAYKNIWIESFKINYEREESEIFQKEKAIEWFYLFYNAANRMVNSKTFAELQKNYFLFRESCIDVKAFSEKDNAILGRCISTLQNLSALEESLYEYMPQNRFRFFVSQLEKEIYVPKNTGCAVSIFPYRVAAGTPFIYHFVLNCSQKQTSVVYDKLSFLRKDKREALGVFEMDASPYFFYAYSEAANSVFSFTGHSFSGYSIINERLENETACAADTVQKLNALSFYDSFQKEEDEIHSSIYPVQKLGAENESKLKHGKAFSFITSGYKHSCKILSEAVIKNIFQNNSVKLSQEDLNLFYTCPVKWFLKKIIKIKFKKYDAQIINAVDIGLVSHAVFENLYKRIRKEDAVFNKNNLEKYKKMAEEEIKNIAAYSKILKGGLAKPFIQSLNKKTLEAVDFVLQTDAQLLDGYIPAWIEEWIEIDDSGILYRGKIDRVSFSQDESGAVIIDYKTGDTPAYVDYGEKGSLNAELKDFQIPMYVFLTENKILQNSKNKEENKFGLIDAAYFFNLKDKKNVKIITPDAKRYEKTREQFQTAMDAFSICAKDFANKIREENFAKPDTVKFSVCASCELKHICRETYSVK